MLGAGSASVGMGLEGLWSAGGAFAESSHVYFTSRSHVRESEIDRELACAALPPPPHFGDMSSCPACFAASLRRPARPATREFSSWFSFRPQSPTVEQPVASTSRLPGLASSSATPAALPSRHPARVTPLHYPKTTLTQQGKQLKTRMTRSLQTRKEREALRLFLGSAADLPPAQAVGLVHLFFAYHQPELALEAVLKMHQQGLRIPPALGVKLLKSAYHELVADPEKLATVVGWLEQGVARERRKGDGEATDVELVLTVMDLLKRLGHAEWAMGIFQVWLGSLEEGQVGPAMVWSQAISVLTSVGEVVGAREVFMDWRKRWMEVYGVSDTDAPSRSPPSPTIAGDRAGRPTSSPPPRIPPEQPYTTLLDFLATQPNSAPSSRDPINPILSLITRDNLSLSLPLFHSLLRVELHRKRFRSFWGLWNKLSDAGWARNHRSYALAIKARNRQDWLPQRWARRGGSPLQTLLPATYADAHAPTGRDLFRQLLQDHQLATHGRPSLVLSVKQGSVSSTTMLNKFLRMFVDRADWPAAAVVLETYGVHRVEPDEATHGDVVVGVVRYWEKGQLQGQLEEDRAISLAEQDEQDRSAAGRLAAGRMRKRAVGGGGGEGSGEGAGELISRILEQRQFRVGIFTKGADPAGGEEGSEGAVASASQLAPKWMLTRERRELGYLFSLLRRCEGLDEAQWGEKMVETRKEMLPTPWRKEDRRRAGEVEGGAGQKESGLPV